MGIVTGTSLSLVSGRKIAFSKCCGVIYLYVGENLSVTLGPEGNFQPKHICGGCPHLVGKLYAVVIDLFVAVSV